MDKSTTIIIPTFNEEKRIISTLNDIDSYITKEVKPNLFQVIVVNDGSIDNTKEVVTKWVQKESKNKKCFDILSYSQNQGKGYAVREGFLKTSTDLVLYTDADSASPIEEIEKLQFWTNNEYDIAIGSRILKNENTNVKMSPKRRFTGFIFHKILRILGLAYVKDTQCGFKLFKTKVAKHIAKYQKCFNYSFDIEYLFLAKKLGYKVKEVSINWYNKEGSKVNLLRDSIKMLSEVIKIRFVYKYN